MPVRPIFAVIALLTTVAPVIAQTTSGPGLPPPPPASLDPSLTAPRPGQRPELSVAQRATIFRVVMADRNKATRTNFPAEIGSEVPPAIELYSLPDDAMIEAPITKMYKCVAMGGKVVLVDPTTMRVVEVIER